MANWKMTTGKLDIGALALVLQNWLLSAVKSSGAVSPEIRATANKTPVTMPARAARQVTERMMALCDAPSAAAASRKPLGTRSSMFSVVRTTTGITITIKEAAPAQAEKWPILTTMIS